jgi:3-methyladenine DNA glycosylase AlkD
MPLKKPQPKIQKPAKAAPDVRSVLAALERRGKKSVRDGFQRFGIEAPKAFGVSMGDIHALAKQTGRDHALADALWKSGWYDARLLAAFVAEPERVTPAQMDRWAKDFDNWAVCDTACFHLFDRTPHAFTKIAGWAGRKEEFVKRAAFALLASVALHDRDAPDTAFLRCLPLIEDAADDARNFVKKAVVWALRGVGGRNAALHAEALALAERLAASGDATARWIGKGAARELKSPVTRRRIAKKTSAAKRPARVKALRAPRSVP